MSNMRIKILLTLILIIIIIFLVYNPINITNSTNSLEITKDDEKVILDYLDTKTNDITRPSIGKMYSAYKLLGTDKNKIYIWLVKIEYIEKEGQVTHDGGDAVSLPVVLYIKKDEKGILITHHKFPSDGIYYGKSKMKLFPPNVRENFPYTDYDEKERLEDITLNRAIADFKKG